MDLTRAITHSASGASCKIHDFGVTVLSYKTGAGRECLFVSRDAKLDGSKAVRGGIPLVFPQFGQPDKSMPQHGFLRNNYWKVDESSAYDTADAAGISYTFELKDAKNSRGGKWDEKTDLDCSCVFAIKIGADKMETSLEIKNTASKPFDFQTLQHTYYLVDGNAALDTSQCYVKGLEGYSVSDKVTKEEYTLGADPVTIGGSVDRIYTPPAGKGVVDVTIGVGGGKTIKMTATGLLDGSSVPVSCVVWNPHKKNAAKMGDFGDDQVSYGLGRICLWQNNY
jgi:glucose-6-phosphate 1-epimerase